MTLLYTKDAYSELGVNWWLSRCYLHFTSNNENNYAWERHIYNSAISQPIDERCFVIAVKDLNIFPGEQIK